MPAGPAARAVVLATDASEVRRVLAPTAWMVLEELLLRSNASDGECIASESVRRSAGHWKYRRTRSPGRSANCAVPVWSRSLNVGPMPARSTLAGRIPLQPDGPRSSTSRHQRLRVQRSWPAQWRWCGTSCRCASGGLNQSDLVEVMVCPFRAGVCCCVVASLSLGVQVAQISPAERVSFTWPQRMIGTCAEKQSFARLRGCAAAMAPPPLRGDRAFRKCPQRLNRTDRADRVVRRS